LPSPRLGHGIVSAQTDVLEGAQTRFVHPLNKAGSMSHKGHERHRERVSATSAVTPKADIRVRRNIRRSGPIASFRTAEKQRAFSHRIIVKLITDLPIGA
jgi:hypothetical protein